MSQSFVRIICFALLPSLLVSTAHAQISNQCKEKLTGQKLKVIIPNAPGGGYDTYGRALAPVIDQTSGTRSSVVNLPAASGLVALTTLANSEPEELVVMVENAGDVLRSPSPPDAEPFIERLEMLGVFHAEPSAWIGRSNFSFDDATNLVAASTSADGIIEFELAGRAIGKNVKMISGYDGSKELEAAVLRGDADLFSSSLSTALKATKSGDLKVVMLLSDQPSERATNASHIAGVNGLVDKISTSLPPEQRSERMKIADLVVYGSYDVRTVFTHKALRIDLRDCLRDVTDVAIRDPAFVKAASAQGRPVTPMSSSDAEAFLATQKAYIAEIMKIETLP